jgi:hypothetical protein
MVPHFMRGAGLADAGPLGGGYKSANVEYERFSTPTTIEDNYRDVCDAALQIASQFSPVSLPS